MNYLKSMLLLVLLGGIVSCSQSKYKKTPGGMPYQLFASKDTNSVRPGYFIKLSLTQKINDSVYFTTDNKLPLYLQVRSESNPYDVSEVWTSLHLGDSLVATQMMDTFIKRMPGGGLPPQFKNGDRIFTFVKVLGIFQNDSLKSIDEKKVTLEFAANESKAVQSYLEKNKINATQKTPSGVYVEVFDPGAGDFIKAGNYVSLKYTGKTLAGVVFDSNVDTAFKHTDLLNFTVQAGQMIKGFDDAMLLLKKGAKAKLYLPSTLAYGAAPPPGAAIKPYENIMFEVMVMDVKEKEPVQQAPPPPPAPKK